MIEGAKKDEGKVRWYLIPWEPLKALAALYTMGARKYEPENWRKGIAYSRIFSAMMRHAWAWYGGETHDPEDGQHHLTSVAWCAFTLMWYELYRPKFDDRYKDEPEETWTPDTAEELAKTAFRMAAEIKYVPAVPRPDILEHLATCRVRAGISLPARICVYSLKPRTECCCKDCEVVAANG